jgi:hypothetical protein
MCIQSSPAEIRTPTQCNLIGRSMTAPPPVIAQQFSSATFLSSRFHSGNEKFGVRFKNFTISVFYYLKNYVSETA